MGQGLYDAVGFGVLNPPKELYEYEAAEEILEFSYETKPEYAVIVFGVSDEWLQDYWGVAPVPDDAPRVAKRKAKRAPGLHVPGTVKAVWELLRKVAKADGLELPKPGPIVFSDWD